MYFFPDRESIRKRKPEIETERDIKKVDIREKDKHTDLKEREIERLIDREKQTDREMDRQTGRQTDIDRQADIEIKKEKLIKFRNTPLGITWALPIIVS